MRLTIFAATGGVGRHLVTQALDAGHQVTAVARNPRNLPAGARVEGADAVLSGLGPRDPRKDAGVTSRGTRAIVAAMQAAHVRRLVVVSAAPVGTVASPGQPNPPKHDPGDGFFMRHLGAPFARTMFGAHYADLAVMEDMLRDSGLDWTIDRPPKFNDKPLTGRYRVAFGRNIRGGFSIPRADVAHHMLRVLDEPETIKQVIGLAT
jgi:uncharacterized protein YbjT (DUF2867 family)